MNCKMQTCEKLVKTVEDIGSLQRDVRDVEEQVRLKIILLVLKFVTFLLYSTAVVLKLFLLSAINCGTRKG